jgi:methyltransferase-like protein 6
MDVQYHDHDYPFEELLPVGQAFEKQLAAGTTTSSTTTPIISWEIFHSRHDQGKFFKLKRYLVAEFPDVLAMDTEETVLLDVGCGNGAALVPFLRVTDHLRAVAFDCSASAIKILRSFVEDTPNEERVQTHVCDLMSNPIPLSDASIDVALLIFVLSAVPVNRMPDVLSEVHRVLRPGSLLCFRDYGVYDLTHLRSTNEQWLGGKTF